MDIKQQSGWEHFEHQADIGVRGVGQSPAQAFEQAAIALMAVICDPAGVESRSEIQIKGSEPDLESLFYDWLNQLISEMAVSGMLFSRFKVEIDGTSLTGRAWGEPADPEKHNITVEVKAATYAQLKVENTNGRWLAQCIVDV